MGRTLGMAVGGLMLIVGLVWVMQGLGYLGGSSMTGDSKWAVIGSVVGLLGVALAIAAMRRQPPPLE